MLLFEAQIDLLRWIHFNDGFILFKMEVSWLQPSKVSK